MAEEVGAGRLNRKSVTLTDPSGENSFVTAAVLGGVIGGAAYGYGSQVARNLAQGMCFWDALSDNISAGDVALYAGLGTLMGIGLGVSIYGGWSIGIKIGLWGVINTGTFTVYQYVENGVVRYIGQTSNYISRAQTFMAQRGWQVKPIAGLQNLNEFDARAVEQVLIEYYRLENLYNAINSISINNPIYYKSIIRGIEILIRIGYFK